MPQLKRKLADQGRGQAAAGMMGNRRSQTLEERTNARRSDAAVHGEYGRRHPSTERGVPMRSNATFTARARE